MTAFNPSPAQQTIFNWVKNGRGSAVVIAVAGSGKTTTCVESLAFIPEHQSVRMLAFNKPIADEFGVKIKKVGERIGRPFRNVRASTFHALGNGALRKYLSIPDSVEPKGDKLRTLCDRVLTYGKEPYTGEMYGEYMCKMVSLAKGIGIGVLVPDTDQVWWDLAKHHDILLDHEDANEVDAIGWARRLLTDSNKAAKDEYLFDFDDMLYLPLLYKLRLWQNDWVFVDEAQDTNPVRRALAKLALRPGGRLVAVGDPRQAIYGFTGASHDAIDQIKHQFNAIELPLTVSYRCSAAVVAQAQTIVEYIRCHDDAELGKVEDIKLKDALKILGNHDAIVCRTSAPLLKLAYELIAGGRACKILGREIGQGLVKLVRLMKARDIETLEEKLQVYLDRETAKFMGRGEEGKAEAVSDRVQCIRVVIENLPEDDRTVAGVTARIESLFTDGNSVLILCTAHKAKGKEWDRVAVLRPDLMPSKWARQDWQVVQEQNLMYVAWTRAKSHLMFLTTDSLKDGK